MDNRILELLIKKKLGTLSLSEHTELGNLTADMEEVAHNIDEFWEQPLTYEANPGDTDLDACLSKLNGKIDALPKLHKVEKRISWKKMTAIAAGLIFLASFSVVYLRSQKAEIEHLHTVVTRKGSKSMVILPDGSKVWINNDSKIIYGKSFGKDIRELTLVGEAYFEVVKDRNKPFIVHTKEADIRVLGTKFNVKAYKEDAKIETTLLTGAVEVDIKGENTQIIRLKPNEKVTIYTTIQGRNDALEKADEPKIVLRDIRKGLSQNAIVLETQWLENRLAFEQEKLANIIPILERWYNVKIESKVPEAMDKKITGTFQDESLPDILTSILTVMDLKYKMNNQTISIYK